jgi:hypothetical protein
MFRAQCSWTGTPERRSSQLSNSTRRMAYWWVGSLKCKRFNHTSKERKLVKLYG